MKVWHRIPGPIETALGDFYVRDGGFILTPRVEARCGQLSITAWTIFVPGRISGEPTFWTRVYVGQGTAEKSLAHAKRIVRDYIRAEKAKVA